MLDNQSKVLLPEWLLERRTTLTDNEYLQSVYGYLKRYPNYQFIRLEDCFAICNRYEDTEKKEKKRGKKK